MSRPVHRIDIGRLVVEGLNLNRRQAGQVRVLLEKALAEQLSVGALATDAVPDGGRLRAPDLHIDKGMTQTSLAADLAQAVAGALRGGERE